MSSEKFFNVRVCFFLWQPHETRVVLKVTTGGKESVQSIPCGTMAMFPGKLEERLALAVALEGTLSVSRLSRLVFPAPEGPRMAITLLADRSRWNLRKENAKGYNGQTKCMLYGSERHT